MMRSSIPPRGWTINTRSLSSCGDPSFTEKPIGTKSAQSLTLSSLRAHVTHRRQRCCHPPPAVVSHREVHRHALALGEAVEHALERELAADAALLVAAVGHAGHLAAALVDLHPARFDGVRGPEAGADIVRPDIGGEAVMAVVGHGDRLGLFAQADRHKAGAEDLLARQPQIVGPAGVQAADRDNPDMFDAHLCWSASRALCFVPPDTGG